MDVIQAEKSACGPIASMLTRAFINEPISRFIMPRESVYKRIMRMECYCQSLRLVKRGLVSTTSDYSAAAIWRPPGKKLGPNTWETLTSWTTLWAVAVCFSIPPPTLYRILRFNVVVVNRMKKELREPHWTLDILGVDPAYQGTGRAGLLLQHQLERIDAEHLPVYVITHGESNIQMYEHFGFELYYKAAYTKGAPQTASLIRPAR